VVFAASPGSGISKAAWDTAPTSDISLSHVTVPAWLAGAVVTPTLAAGIVARHDIHSPSALSGQQRIARRARCIANNRSRFRR